MRLLLTIYILIPTSLFSQINEPMDSIRKVNNVESVSLVTQHFENDSLTKVDTIHNYQVFDEEGRVVQKKYQAGTQVLEKNEYDENQRLIKTICLTPPPQEQFNPNSENFTETRTIITYVYDESGKIVKCYKKDMWGILEVIVEFKYNYEKQLISRSEIDSLGNVYDFEIHKYSPKGNKMYSIYNVSHMTSDLSYSYEGGNKGGKLLKTTARFNETKTITYFDLINGNIKREEIMDCNVLRATSEYLYNGIGLLVTINRTLLDTETGGKISSSRDNFIYYSKINW